MTYVVLAIVIALLEWWRRAIRDRAPRWVSVIAILCSIEIVLGVVIAAYRLRHAFDAYQSESAGDKATQLADGVASAMSANLISLVGIGVAIVVLTIGSFRRREAAPPTAIVQK